MLVTVGQTVRGSTLSGVNRGSHLDATGRLLYYERVVPVLNGCEDYECLDPDRRRMMWIS